MAIAKTCPGCGVIGGCICHTNSTLPLIPEEPAVTGLPMSPAGAYAQGWRDGWVEAWKTCTLAHNSTPQQEGEE